MSKPVIFHCTPRKTGVVLTKSVNVDSDNTSPTHTLVFDHIGNTLVMGWAVACKGDSYNRKYGRESATERANHLVTRMKSFPNRQITEVDEISVDVLPKKIVEGNLDYYVNRAVKILFSNNHTLENVDVVFRAPDSAEAGVCKVNVSLNK